MVNKGFIVIAPALRESEGGEGKDEVGGNDVHDIMNILPLLNNLGSMQIHQIFLCWANPGEGL